MALFGIVPQGWGIPGALAVLEPATLAARWARDPVQRSVKDHPVVGEVAVGARVDRELWVRSIAPIPTVGFEDHCGLVSRQPGAGGQSLGCS